MTRFYKMQGIGNDFILMEPEEFEKITLSPESAAKKLCDRHFGIGADGLFVPILKPEKGDIGWIFLQSDGSTAQMCGNGMRCFAKFVYDKGYVKKEKFEVQTAAGIIIPEICKDGTVRVNMNKPVLDCKKIPFNAPHNLNQKLWAKDREFVVNAVGMGNPHCLIFTDENTKALAKEYGEEIEHNSAFPEKTNVEFIKVLSRSEIDVDVWERGCGITLACGTGACASAAAAILNGYCGSKVKVNLPGGSLYIEWAGNSQNPDFDVFMTGSADYVFEGSIDI